MNEIQIRLVTWLAQDSPIDTLMRTAWAWPIAESIHFLGLCLLIGTVGTFDLRLIGIGRRIPIAALHRLIPFGLLGFGLNIMTGTLFVMTEPDQYIYNPAFHLKVLFLFVAGVNASLFYLTSWRQVFGGHASADAPIRARVIAIVSLAMWMGVIVAGRMITFYRPGPCRGEVEIVLTCQP